MQYEVENKFPVPDHQAVTERLHALDVQLREPIEQVDLYFAHPVRDFAETDEALRIRRVGTRNFVTYKGPKIDAATKTRRELELPLADGAARTEQYAELLAAVGFRPVATVRKSRRRGRLYWHNEPVEIALDEVAQLGSFVELELQADEDGLTAAQQRLLELAGHLGLPAPERRSYLEMLLGQA